MKLHNEEFHDLCCSPNIVSDQMVGLKRRKMHTGFGGGGDLNGRNHMEYLVL
jgi:hypothetical protein